MTDTYTQMRAFERERWARQADVLRAWLDVLPAIAPQADALRRVFAAQEVPDAALAQMRFDLERDLGRLGSALAGKTPTAVDRTTDYGGPEGFARHEAAHTVDNALVFLSKARAARELGEAGAAVERAQRWIQRLRWELVDTGVQADVPVGFSAAAVDDTAHVPQLAARTATALSELRSLLSH